MKLSQAQIILNRIKEQGYIYSWEITTHMGYQQYNARISDAREIIGCLFVDRKHSPHCPSHEHILSEKDNKFIYVNDQAHRFEKLEEEMAHNPSNDLNWKEIGLKLGSKKYADEKSIDEVLNKKRREFFALSNELGYEAEKSKDRAKHYFQVESFNDLTFEQLDKLVILFRKQQRARDEKNIMEGIYAKK